MSRSTFHVYARISLSLLGEKTSLTLLLWTEFPLLGLYMELCLEDPKDDPEAVIITEQLRESCVVGCIGFGPCCSRKSWRLLLVGGWREDM